MLSAPVEVQGPTTPLAVEIDQRYLVIPEFTLENGAILTNAPVAFKTWGTLDRDRANVVLVSHPISGNANVAEWWGPLFGPGHTLDPTRYFIVCCNTIGSPYGTASPLTRKHGEMFTNGAWVRAPHIDKPMEQEEQMWWGADFPSSTVRDDVRLHKCVLEYLGVEQLAAVIGGSMGGMAALEWPLCFPVRHPSSPNAMAEATPKDKPYVRAIVALASSARHSAWCIAWSEVQRRAVMADEKYNQGRYLLRDPPEKGLAAARMCALMTYRQPQSFERRFSRLRGTTNVKKAAPRKLNPEASSLMEEGDEAPSPDILKQKQEQDREQYAVQSYLYHHGNKFVKRFDALCYIHLTQKLDTHDAARDRTSWTQDVDQSNSTAVLAQVLRYLGVAPVAPRVQILSVTSDLLYTPNEQEFVHASIPKSALVHIESPEGHDGFLLEYPQIEAAIRPFLHTDVSTSKL
ncbi:homoserine O-acetyltransferase [Malassezia vespertilionis]|uniref:Met2p n=1 Tax=Malassezia vespertilionis TaxID=2020962 RepID=A0A2N1JCM2_9BASI|nr:homoserine O-acetyltransferase [Malassezia vespertilionis]PKI84310.1 Met2p [Malassezia vespertilionis]WFD06288.1 homoserine O-acetyltransferase [Malassezia vespertilionis]